MPPEEGQQALCDFVTYNVAIEMLQYAAANRAKTGQPFFQVTGIKRPHLNWRAPAGYVDMYPIESVAPPTQLTLDKSIDPVAYTVFPMDAPLSANASASPDFVHSPYTHGTDYQLRELRQHYYAAVSWADFATGQILNELDNLKLTEDTMVVLHSGTVSCTLCTVTPAPPPHTQSHTQSLTVISRHPQPAKRAHLTTKPT
jgi:arylsulfatase A-like enzyme|eukprot:COSAG03_NODE_1876_length_3399_cov_3.350303_4_plen_200_part_00